jgi:hypothetical protein
VKTSLDLPPIEFIGEQSHSRDNCAYILQLEEELDRARATIQEQTKHIVELQSQLKAKNELIRSLQDK